MPSSDSNALFLFFWLFTKIYSKLPSLSQETHLSQSRCCSVQPSQFCPSTKFKVHWFRRFFKNWNRRGKRIWYQMSLIEERKGWKWELIMIHFPLDLTALRSSLLIHLIFTFNLIPRRLKRTKSQIQISHLYDTCYLEQVARILRPKFCRPRFKIWSLIRVQMSWLAWGGG